MEGDVEFFMETALLARDDRMKAYFRTWHLGFSDCQKRWLCRLPRCARLAMMAKLFGLGMQSLMRHEGDVDGVLAQDDALARAIGSVSENKIGCIVERLLLGRMNLLVDDTNDGSECGENSAEETDSDEDTDADLESDDDDEMSDTSSEKSSSSSSESVNVGEEESHGAPNGKKEIVLLMGGPPCGPGYGSLLVKVMALWLAFRAWAMLMQTAVIISNGTAAREPSPY